MEEGFMWLFVPCSMYLYHSLAIEECGLGGSLPLYETVDGVNGGKKVPEGYQS